MDVLEVAMGIGAGAALLGYHLFKVREIKELHRIDAEKAFQDSVVESNDPRYSFCGHTAQCMNQREEVEQIEGIPPAYALTRIARNQSGEYFWFCFRSDTPPVIKHIDHARAKVLLKTKYIAPPTENAP